MYILQSCVRKIEDHSDMPNVQYGLGSYMLWRRVNIYMCIIMSPALNKAQRYSALNMAIQLKYAMQYLQFLHGTLTRASVHIHYGIDNGF